MQLKGLNNALHLLQCGGVMSLPIADFFIFWGSLVHWKQRRFALHIPQLYFLFLYFYFYFLPILILFALLELWILLILVLLFVSDWLHWFASPSPRVKNAWNCGFHTRKEAPKSQSEISIHIAFFFIYASMDGNGIFDSLLFGGVQQELFHDSKYCILWSGTADHIHAKTHW